MSKQMSLRELISPTPRQEEFFRVMDSYKFTLYGGAKGGGKSYILRWATVRQLLKWAKQGYKGVRAILACEDYPALKDRQITKINSEFPAWLGKLSESQVEGMSFVLRPQYGSGIIALRNLDDPSKYASSEFALAAVDELTKDQRQVFDQLRSIIRWPGIENTKFIAGTNPGGIGHAWVKKLWIDRQFTVEDPLAEQVAFVKSLPTDNPYNAQSYLEELKKLPEKLRKAYWDGNWDVFEGQYFTEWDSSRHVAIPFQIPLSWKKYRAYDHGREAPACCKWYALDQDGRIWVYRELYVKGLNIDQIAEKINKMSEGEEYEYSVADPSIFSRTGFIDRKSGSETIAQAFANQGIIFHPASNRRIDGWNLMHQYLYWNQIQYPKLIYFNSCYDSIRTIPLLKHDDNKPEDLDTKGEDHAADCDRYIILSLNESRTVEKQQPEEPEWFRRQMNKDEFSIQKLYE